MGSGVSGWVAEHDTPILNGNLSAECGYLADPQSLSVMRSALAVPLEGVSWRVLASGPRPFLRLNARPSAESKNALKGQRPVYFPEWQEHRPTNVYDRYLLVPGAELEGPAIVEERESTTVIGPGARIQIDESRNLSVLL